MIVVVVTMMMDISVNEQFRGRRTVDTFGGLS
jgi:hypothetical protein